MSRHLIRVQQRRHLILSLSLGLVILFALVVSWGFRVASNIRLHSLPVGEVHLSVPYTTYLVGEPVTFTVRNGYNSPIYISNDCPNEPLNVYRLENTKWVRIHDKASASDCPKEDRQILIPANGSVNGDFKAWHHLFSQPGKYRVAAYVEYYSAVPYQEFEVISPPPPYVAAVVKQLSNSVKIASNSSSKTSGSQQNSAISASSTPILRSSSTPRANPTPTPAPISPYYIPKHYTLNVNSAGNYNLTSLSAHPSDTLTINYSTPRTAEVVTSFTALNGTSAIIRSVTVDSEHTSRTITLTAAGTWRFKATDHNGNSGTLTVN